MMCTSCGREIPQESRFCPHCGASQVNSTEERRIVTVVFADVVGFTGMAERLDPEEVKHMIDRAVERLAREILAFGGVVDKVLGDGIIALFGAPVAHEDDAERAVRAALRMHEAVDSLQSLPSPLRLRIGVNTGEVLVGSTTAGGDYTAMGDVMNLAHRLQELAEPSQTLVGGDTRRATGDAIAYSRVGELPARGREAPIEAWLALTAVRPPGLHRGGDDVFVGRHHELVLLEAQARLAVEGNRAQSALVLGEAGIGKTRLVGQAAGRLVSQFGARVLEGRCLPYGEANVWWPAAEILRGLFGLPVDAGYDDAVACLDGRLATLLGDDSTVDRLRTTTALLHTLGYDTVLRGGDRTRNRSEVMLSVVTVLEAELRQRPVVLMISDMHWAHDAVWVLIEHMLNELVRTRLFVLMTARPSDDLTPPAGRHGLSVVQLGPLDDASAIELLKHRGIDLPESSEIELVDRSGGNPFFLEELADLVNTEGTPYLATGSDFDVTPVAALPATLRGIISARLDALDLGQRALIEDASVLGRTGSLAGLAIVAANSRGVTDITADLAGLVDRELLEVTGQRFRFRSNLVRDVAYGRLTKTVRAQRHQQIAAYLEAQQGEEVRNSIVVAIAAHYRAAAQLASELSDVPGLDYREVVGRALYWIAQAGERALDVGAPTEATRWYDFGVELADETTVAPFLFGRARARAEVHDIHGARADLDRLDALCELDPALAARSLLTRGEVNRKAGVLDQASAELREAADRLATLGDAEQQALALRLLGMTEMVRSDAAMARKALEASRAVAVAAGNRRAEAWALQSLAWHAYRLGQMLEASTQVAEAIEIFTEIDDRGGLLWAQSVQAWVAFHSGDWNHARLLLDTILPETKRRGDPWAEALTLNLEASIRLWSGQAALAVDSARDARHVADRVEHVNLAVQATALHGRALLSLGRLEEGFGLLEEAYWMADQADDREGRRIAVVANCAAASRMGEAKRALRWAARFDGLDDDGDVGRYDLVVSLAAASLQQGEVATALAQLDSIADGVPLRSGAYASAIGAIAQAAAGDLGRSEALTVEVLSGRGTYLDRVFALAARAACRRQQGDDHGCVQALWAAKAVLEPTDDQPSRYMIDLVAGVCGQSSLPEAQRRMRAAGLEAAGWMAAFDLAAHRPVGPVG
ncbi:MAG: adenylate/guanylate cyclase domain-containing protein [Acidimicrobiales bacterium]